MVDGNIIFIDFSKYEIYRLTKKQLIVEIKKTGHSFSTTIRSISIEHPDRHIPCKYSGCEFQELHNKMGDYSSKRAICALLYNINPTHNLFVLKKILPTSVAWNLSIKDLKNIAKENNIDISGLKKKIEIYKKIREILPEDDRFDEIYTKPKDDLAKMMKAKKNTPARLDALKSQFGIVFPHSSILKTLFEPSSETRSNRDNFYDWYEGFADKKTRLRFLLILLENEAEFYGDKIKEMDTEEAMKFAEEAWKEDEKYLV